MDYLPGQRPPAIQAPTNAMPTAHPAVLSYLASGSPLRQGFVQGLQNPALPPGGFVPPSLTTFMPPPTAPPLLNPGSYNPGEIPYQPRLLANKNGEIIGGGGSGSGGGGGGGGGVDAGSVSYLNDPILQEALAAQAAALKTSRGNLLSQYEDLLLGFGSQELAKTTLSKLLGQAGYSDLPGGKKIDKFLASVSDNPDTSQSTMAQLARALREATRTTNEGMSSSQGGNLFFSGAHARSLRDLDYQHQAQTANATQALRQALFGASQGELATEQSWSQQILAAEEAAYSRALQVALANAAMASGGYGSGGSGDGGGSGGDGGSTPGQVTPANAPANAPGQISQGVPWQVALPLSLLNPNDIRVRRLQ